MQDILVTENLTKTYPGVKALDRFGMTVRRGEVHGLVGENGAGKSTLVKVLAGALRPDGGRVVLGGEEVHFRSPHDAMGKIGVVHQERELVGHFDACANIFLGEETTSFGAFLDRRAMREKTRALMDKWGMDIPLGVPASDLGSGQQQMIMIMRILLGSPGLMIFDEPTASLSAGECAVLFRLIDDLKAHGTSVIYISHNLAEVVSLCDRITVMRNGKNAGTLERGAGERELIRLMIDHDIDDQYPKPSVEIGGEVFSAKDYSCPQMRIKKADFSVRRGEIVGFAGLVGSGRTELAQAVFCGKAHSGALSMRGKPFASRSPAASIKNGMAMIPQDRRGEGVVTGQSTARNIQLPGLKGALCRGGLIDFGAAREAVGRTIGRYSIKVSSPSQPVETLSGGNQQKVAVGKWDGHTADLWIFDEPTQGIDVEAKREIYAIMGRIAQGGAGIWYISSELRELTAMSDRIYVMNGGEVTEEFAPPYDREKILAAMMRRSPSGISDKSPAGPKEK